MDRSAAEQWMREAIVEAKKAGSEGEVPVGAILLVNEKIVGRAHNHCIQANDPTAHAEILALRQAAFTMRNYRLPGSILIVTIEPCVMCAGAMVQARVEELIFGALDPKAGAIRSHFHLADAAPLNHSFQVTSGVLEDECAGLVRSFFEARR
ncbi:MAG: tRNA adenosine(34) deaminase TadA [Acidobacteriota bacterium]